VTAASPEPQVIRCGELPDQSLTALLSRYDLSIDWIENEHAIPGSYFGEPEAGLIGDTLFLRSDTPVHSALHEACHYICMRPARRVNLHTDAGGDYDEENAVCYLSILLADYIDDYDREQMMQDMDAWGYTFRLGSACSWFERDAEDAHEFLLHQQIINKDNKPTWQTRGMQ